MPSVLHIGDASYIHLRRWVLQFDRLGWRQAVITRRSYEAPAGSLPEAVKQYVMPRPPGSQLTYGLLSLWFPRYFTNVTEEFEPDLLHVHSLLHGLISAFVGFHPKIVTVWGYHHLTHSWAMKRRLERRALSSADAITVHSPKLKEEIHRLYGVPKNRVRFLFWGVDLTLFKRGYEREVEELRQTLGLEWADHIFLSSRAIAPLYNADAILRAFENVARSRAGLALVLLRGTGSEEYETQMRALARRLGVEEKVRFVSRFLSQREMATMFNASDAFISIPTTDQLAYSVIEGMACGSIPVISDLPDYNGIIESGVNGYRVAPRDEKGLGEILGILAEDKLVRETCARLNREFVDKFADVRKNANEIASLYEGLVDEARPSKCQ